MQRSVEGDSVAMTRSATPRRFRGSGRVPTSWPLGLTALLALVLAGCSQYSGDGTVRGAATEDVATVAALTQNVRSIDLTITNISRTLAFQDVGFSLESGEWVAEPGTDATLSPGSRTQILAEATAPEESVSGYVTFVSADGGDLTVQFSNSASGARVELLGSLGHLAAKHQTPTREAVRASFDVVLDSAATSAS